MDGDPGADPGTHKTVESPRFRIKYDDIRGFYYVRAGMATGLDVASLREAARAYSTDADRQKGLQRTDNNMELTSWPQVPMINQKNYYT